MEELFRFINVSCETSRFYLRNFSFMFGRGELIAISSDTTSAKDALVLLLTRQIEPTSGKISWNAKGGAHSLISYEDHLLYKHLSIAENLSLTYPSSNRFFFSQKRNSLNARLILEKYGIFWDVNKPVYSLTKLQQYILRIVKAVYLGAEYLILSDVVRLHYDADFSLLRDLVRTLLEHQISILLTDSYQNPLFICSDACRILRFEGGMFVRLLNGQEDQYIPPMSGAAGAAGAAFSGRSATRDSVVRTMEETDAAFSSALRQTLVGSTMPLSIMSPKVSCAAS